MRTTLKTSTSEIDQDNFYQKKVKNTFCKFVNKNKYFYMRLLQATDNQIQLTYLI